jgi:hypothetical protein
MFVSYNPRNNRRKEKREREREREREINITKEKKIKSFIMETSEENVRLGRVRAKFSCFKLFIRFLVRYISTQVKQSFQLDSDPDYVGFRRNPTKHGRDSIGLYAVPVVSDDRNPTERIPTTHSRDPTEIIWIRWDPTGYN